MCCFVAGRNLLLWDVDVSSFLFFLQQQCNESGARLWICFSPHDTLDSLARSNQTINFRNNENYNSRTRNKSRENHQNNNRWKIIKNSSTIIMSCVVLFSNKSGNRCRSKKAFELRSRVEEAWWLWMGKGIWLSVELWEQMREDWEVVNRNLAPKAVWLEVSRTRALACARWDEIEERREGK